MSDHVPEDRLLAFTLGQLEGDEARGIDRHVATCADCKRRQEALSSVAFSKTAVGSSKDGQPTRGPGAGGGSVGLERGAALGRYVVLEKLGAGGMGEVFAAYDPQLDRKVAIKLLRSGALSAAEGKARLLREAQAMARLQHPNVIAVHDVGVFRAPGADGGRERVFVAMEFVDGETLADWLRQRHGWEETVRLFLQAGAGLAAAHRAGLIHRDFKPDNVLIGREDGRPRVLDFGLARQSNATPATPSEAELDVPVALSSDSKLAAPLTRDGAVMGTPGYMAPEQIGGLATDARSDQFAFCVALWEGLFGQRPFSGSTLKQLALEIETARIAAVPADAQVPSYIVDALRQGLQANPSQRWPDMDGLLRALRPRARRNPRRTLFAAGLVLFSLLGIGYGVWTRQRLLVCGGSEARLAGTWDAQRKARLRAGFAATNLSYAADAWANTERALDAWAAEWVVTARDVCEASKLRKTDSPEVTELKNACLSERLGRLAALVALFETPDHDVVNNAPLAARDLEPALSCTQATALRRSAVLDEKERAAEQALSARLTEARALFAAGKYALAADRLKQGLDPVVPPANQAEAYLWLGRIEIKRGEAKLARNAHVLAVEQALKSGEAGLTARALSRLYASEGYDEGDSDAETWSRLASAAAARVPGDWEVQVELALNDGFVGLRRKRYKAALADFEQALALQQEHLGAEHPDVASTLNNLGVVLTSLDRPDEAVARYEESLRLHEKLEGAEHPNVATASHNLAVALRRMGRVRDARDAFERALAVRRKALGLNNNETLKTALALVRLLVSIDELEPARALLDEAREARVLMTGPESAEMLPVLETEAELYLAGGFWKEALDTATHHLAIAKSRGPPGQRDVAMAMIEQAIAWTQLGAWADARKALSEVQRRHAAGDTNFDDSLLFEALGRLELAQGHAPLATPWFEKAIEHRSANPIVAARTEVLLAHTWVDAGEPGKALPLLVDAIARFTDARLEQPLVAAQVAAAQARWLAEPATRADSLEELKSLVPTVAEPNRPAVEKWIAEHADAGVP